LANYSRQSGLSVHFFAAFCGWLVPGLGHVLIGERQRGLVIGLTVGGLWLGGLLIGGVSVIDRYGPPENGLRRMPLQFLGQVMVAPSCVVAAVNSGYLQPTYGYPPAVPDGPDGSQKAPGYSPSYGRMNEQGILYTSLAGLLNLLALIDVVYREQRPATNVVGVGG